MKNVIILHNPVDDSSKEDEIDVLEQAVLIENALSELGFGSHRASFGLSSEIILDMAHYQPDTIVFNLVETVNGSGKYSYMAPSILELFGIPFTGSSASAIFTTTDKVICKTLLLFHQIATPVWANKLSELVPEKYYIVKPVAEDGSVGIEDDMITQGNQIIEIPNGFFAEEYIHGREFNISIIGGKAKYEVLPPAEMCFSNDYYENKPRILGYKAKWDESSPEYQNTTRNFKFEDRDNALLESLKEVAGKCWEIFGLNGYARVDIRVDNENVPQVIEINANPCISPTSGFVAACEVAGMNRTEIINRIIKEAK